MNRFATFLLSSLVTAVAFASPILTLEGRAYSDTQCGYYSSSSGEFLLEIRDARIEADSQVTVQVAFHDSWSQSDGRGYGYAKVQKGPAGYRIAELGPVVVDQRGSFYFDEIQFTYEIRTPGESEVIVERGGDDAAFYSADIPSRSCRAGDWAKLPLRVRPIR
jgi:hypothetical protein